MKLDVIVPAAGESITEADIARWFKADGDLVAMDDPLVELETDKASLEVGAAAAGRLTILVQAGETVKVGQKIGILETELTSAAPTAVTAPAAPAKAETQASPSPDDEDLAKHATIHDLAMPSPAARKLLAENHVSAKDVKGTGVSGRITKADVLQYVAELNSHDAMIDKGKEAVEAVVKTLRPEPAAVGQMPVPKQGIDRAASAATAEAADEDWRRPKASTPPPAATPIKPIPTATTPAAPAAPAPVIVPGGTRVEKLSRMRKTIAQRLVTAQQTQALLTTFNEVDMSGIMDLRKKYKESFQKQYGVGLGFMSFFVRATCLALREFPIINARIEGETVVYHDYCDIGIAVASDRGLVVPVVRRAETLAMAKIEAEIGRLAKRAREGAISIEEMSGGTFSITNGGTFGSMLSTPITNFPQSAILGMHNIVERPVARDGQVVIRPIMYVALTYDHRLIDGSDAVRFLVRLKERLEDPSRLLLEV
jgi:2-oxoglutarate dehydrogenase E2 component (dihydrolipoamide succinyltransferase)